MVGLQIERIPRDVFFNMFSRLPIKCLARLRCVSKFINGIISDPLFQKLHFETSAPEVYPLIFTYRIWRENIISLNQMQLQDQKLQVRFTSIGHLLTSGPHEFVGTCNGLLCFAPCTPEEPLLICNPITSEYISLSKPAVNPLDQSCATTFGFGFQPSSKEHKVVRILAVPANGRDEVPDFHITAEVYTLGAAAGLWRKVQSFPYAPQGGQVFAQGALHWKIHGQHRLEHESDHIMSFDLSTEEFSTTLHPSFEHELSIVELRGSLSAITFSWRQMTVWVSKDRLNNEWDMEYCIPLGVPRGLDSRFPRLVCMWESDGVLVTWLQDRATMFPLKTYYDDQPKERGNNLPPPRYIGDSELYSETSVHQAMTKAAFITTSCVDIDDELGQALHINFLLGDR
ncbi:hypothetical protein Taro_015659, partial [Colocasia esculenta]|nr:hypothetical protein [Colocasia esculenta]